MVKHLWEKKQYIEALIDEDITNQRLKLNNSLDQVHDDNTYDSINLVDRLSNILISAANKSVPFNDSFPDWK